MAIIFKLIESDSDFNNLKSDWENLERESFSCHPSMSFIWCNLWWRFFKHVENNTIGYNKQVEIICGYEGDKLVFILPLIRLQRRIGPLKITFLEFLGQQWGSIDCAILRLYDFDISGLKVFLKENLAYQILYLRQIPLCESAFMSANLVEYSGSPYIDPKDFKNKEEFINQNYSKSLKQNLRTAVNRIRKDNLHLEFESCKVDDNSFEEIIRLSKMKEADKKQSLYLDKNKSLFYREIFLNMNSDVIFIKLSSHNVAYRVNILYKNQKTCIDASYDRLYRKYDPGIMSVDYNFTNTFDLGCEKDNLGPGLDDYKLKFTDKIQYLGYLLLPGKIFGSAIMTSLFKHRLGNKQK
jgi:CelD/BcsL family acetyltransferase involved in cellulose biosynthesis